MLSAAKHLEAQRDRPFAADQGDKRGPSISINRRKSSSKSVGATLMVARWWGVLPVHLAYSKE